MPKDYKCALPSRAGRTLLLGGHRLAIDEAGFVRGVPDDALSYFRSQPAIWLEVAPSGEVMEPPPVLLAAVPAHAIPVEALKADMLTLPVKGQTVTLTSEDAAATHVQLASRPGNVSLHSKTKRRGKKGPP